MRIVIDMQGAQSTGSRNRGIGRYSMALSLAMVRNRGEHEIILALNGLFPNTIETIRAAFDGLLPQMNIRVWHAVGPVAHINSENNWRRKSAELIREAFIASLRPDVVYISSSFEGFDDDAVVSINALPTDIPTAVTLYDLIPYIYRKKYLENPSVEEWYLKKLDYMKHADLWLAISESSSREGIHYLGLSEKRSVNISTDANANFRKIEISPEEENIFRKKYSLCRPFVMYTGGIDYRKNIEGLIRAFSKLPLAVRKAHQLAIVCSTQPEAIGKLKQLIAKQGLDKDEVILTGFVPENDLVNLYNLCNLFIFPSWHEGFGLPVLEAMRCGAIVIGANTSCIPEVIGWGKALFDPHSEKEMAQKIELALTDNKFRSESVLRNTQQSTKFSWDKSAKRAIVAMEDLLSENKSKKQLRRTGVRKPKLAYFSPLPPEKSGIADYSAELLPELSQFYQVDVIVAQNIISNQWIKNNCQIRTVQWFVNNADRYERVLYHFGNSVFHQHMFDLLGKVPGVAVLHDFFLSGVVAHIEIQQFSPDYWTLELYKSHGYPGLRERFHTKETQNIVWKYPCSLSVVQNSLGVIVHSSYSLRLAEKWYGGESTDWVTIPLMRNLPIIMEKEQARKALGCSKDDFLVCSFGMLGPTKLNHRLLNAWLNSSLAQNENCYLIFVGENHVGQYGENLIARIRGAKAKKKVCITGWVDAEVFHQYLLAADIGVQLRTLSRGETSAAVIDCMNYGLATIVNANGSMSDIDQDTVWMLPDEFSEEQLILALETIWEDDTHRYQIGQAAKKIILRDHTPKICAKKYYNAIEHFYQLVNSGLVALPSTIGGIQYSPSNEQELIQLADAIAKSIPPRNRERQLFLDVSGLVQSNTDSSIRNIERCILFEFLNIEISGYRVEPIYATLDMGYKYARRFTQDLLNISSITISDEPIEYAPCDLFFGLAVKKQVTISQQSFYQEMRRNGVSVKFLMYDLLCVQMPQHFPHGAADGFGRWLEVVAESDGALCISKAVAGELTEWVKKNGSVRQRPFTINWSHLGGEIYYSASTNGFLAYAGDTFKALRNRTSFLMIGTLEPRKGYAQVLEAVEQLWQSGVDINLVIVGKEGWLVESLVDRLCSHQERDKRLFWLKGISDEYLEKIYATCTCLIAASYGEGFGLPLIEAAQHKLPVIARDIPVFREVAGDHAFYFVGKEPSQLARVIEEWIELYQRGNHPKSDNMPWLTWRESAQRLLKTILPEAELII